MHETWCRMTHWNKICTQTTIYRAKLPLFAFVLCVLLRRRPSRHSKLCPTKYGKRKPQEMHDKLATSGWMWMLDSFFIFRKNFETSINRFSYLFEWRALWHCHDGTCPAVDKKSLRCVGQFTSYLLLERLNGIFCLSFSDVEALPGESRYIKTTLKFRWSCFALALRIFMYQPAAKFKNSAQHVEANKFTSTPIG